MLTDQAIEEWRRVAPFLSDREAEVYSLRLDGCGYGRVARHLGVCESRGREIVRRVDRKVTEVARVQG